MPQESKEFLQETSHTKALSEWLQLRYTFWLDPMPLIDYGLYVKIARPCQFVANQFSLVFVKFTDNFFLKIKEIQMSNRGNMFLRNLIQHNFKFIQLSFMLKPKESISQLKYMQFK